MREGIQFQCYIASTQIILSTFCFWGNEYTAFANFSDSYEKMKTNYMLEIARRRGGMEGVHVWGVMGGREGRRRGS